MATIDQLIARPPSPNFQQIIGDPFGAYAQGQQFQQQQQIQNARKQSLADLPRNPDGTVNAGEVAARLAQAGDFEGLRQFSSLADTQALRQYNIKRDERDFGLRQQQFGLQQQKANQPQIVGNAETGYFMVDRSGRPVGAPSQSAGAPAAPGMQPIIPGRPRRPSATEQRAVFQAEDEAAGLDNTITSLQRAKELVPQAYSGAGAGVRGMIGDTLPDMLVPDRLAAPGKSANTVELNQILSNEAIMAMSQALKGATTDREMREFQRVIADPNVSQEVKMRAIDRMIAKAQNKQMVLQGRVQQLRGPAAAPAQQPATPTAQQPMNDPPVISQAREAIARGADPQAVMQRLRQNGVQFDPRDLELQ